MLADFRPTVDDLARYPGEAVSTTQRDDAIELAVAQYSAHRPRTVVVDVVATADGIAPLPAGWQEGFSQLLNCADPDMPDFPIEAALQQSPTERYLAAEVAAGESLRVFHTQTHTVDADTDTVPLVHRLAVCSLAASFLCGQMSANTVSTSAPTIGADSADHNSQSDRWRSRERELRGYFYRELGISEKPGNEVRPAGATVDWGSAQRRQRLMR